MDLPEILFQVAVRLDLCTLVSCSRVSKLWNQVFEQELYREVDNACPPPISALIRHVNNIRSLTLSPNGSQNFIEALRAVQCRQLTHLVISFSNIGTEDEFMAFALTLLQSNQGLLTLEISDGGLARSNFWHLVLGHCGHALKELYLSDLRLEAQDTEQLLSIGQRLSVLEMSDCPAESVAITTTGQPQFPRMKTLHLGYIFESAMEGLTWIEHCPNLEALNWQFDQLGDGTRSGLYDRVKSARWSHLQDIGIFPTDPLVDCEIAAILDACSRLRILRLPRSGFWYRALKSLERHFETLELVDLGECVDVRSWFGQLILSSCPRLTYLYCEIISAHEMVDSPEAEEARRRFKFEVDDVLDVQKLRREAVGQHCKDPNGLVKIMNGYSAARVTNHGVRPWVCLGLERLFTFFQFERDAEPRWDEPVFEQLSKMINLNNMDLNILEKYAERYPSWRGLAFDLQSGLGHLCSLQKMRYLTLDRNAQSMDEQDGEWLLDHWPDFEVISAKFNADVDTDHKLTSLFLGAGVRVYAVE
ncbi:hypothetical protein BGZ83_002584 [Gryganskiella cystojenkinii]|nr:hypothetical protein BGZ83_002584 [Gryganskiella cystojenkinii]